MPRYVPSPLSQGTEAFTWPLPQRGETDELVWDALVYAAEPGYRPLFLDVRVPAPGAPIVLCLHGGGWMAGSRRRLSANVGRHWFVERLLLAGVAVALVDVRLAREAPFPAPVADVRAAVRWLRAHAADLGVDPERVALWGESAGAHLACMAATCDRPVDRGRRAEHLDQPEDVLAVAAWYGPAELGDDRELVNDAWDAAAISPATYARRDVPPILLVHGRDDDVVPVEQSRGYHAVLAAAGADVDYLETEGGHVFDGSGAMEDAVARTVTFLAERLGAAGPAGASAAPAPSRYLAGGAEVVREARPGEVDHVIAALRAGDGASLEAVHRLREAGVAVTLRVFPSPDTERARRWLDREIDRLTSDGPWR